eukprot:3483756-Pleurochrysis_carterae.AAC.1
MIRDANSRSLPHLKQVTSEHCPKAANALCQGHCNAAVPKWKTTVAMYHISGLVMFKGSKSIERGFNLRLSLNCGEYAAIVLEKHGTSGKKRGWFLVYYIDYFIGQYSCQCIMLLVVVRGLPAQGRFGSRRAREMEGGRNYASEQGRHI